MSKQLKENRILLSKEERIEFAKNIYEKAKELGLNYVELDDSQLGGYIKMKYSNNNTADHVEWIVGKYGDIHIAGTIPPNQKGGYSFLINSEDYKTDTIDRIKLIELSRKAVKYEGVVGTAIEALVEIPTLGGWFVYCPNEDLRKLCKYWLRHFGSVGEDGIVTNENTVQQVGGIEMFTINNLWSLYTDGDSVFTEVWENVPVPELGGKRRNLPTRYIDHDVTELSINQTMVKMGQEVIKAKIDEEIINIVKKGPKDDDEKKILESIPDNLRESIKKGEDEIELPSEFTTHFSRKTNKRSAWGLPYVIKALPALAYKHRLRDLDNATIDGLIQRVWIIKVGHPDPDSPMHVPEEDRLLLAISTFRTLQTQNFMIWGGSDLTTEEFGSSENNVLNFKDRYVSADTDIRTALGVPRLLLDGEGSSANQDWSIFAKTISQMERYQIMIQRWIDHKLRQIAIENGFKDQYPKFYWMFLKMQEIIQW